MCETISQYKFLAILQECLNLFKNLSNGEPSDISRPTRTSTTNVDYFTQYRLDHFYSSGQVDTVYTCISKAFQ